MHYESTRAKPLDRNTDTPAGLPPKPKDARVAPRRDHHRIRTFSAEGRWFECENRCCFFPSDHGALRGEHRGVARRVEEGGIMPGFTAHREQDLLGQDSRKCRGSEPPSRFRRSRLGWPVTVEAADRMAEESAAQECGNCGQLAFVSSCLTVECSVVSLEAQCRAFRCVGVPAD